MAASSGGAASERTHVRRLDGVEGPKRPGLAVEHQEIPSLQLHPSVGIGDQLATGPPDEECNGVARRLLQAASREWRILRDRQLASSLTFERTRRRKLT